MAKEKGLTPEQYVQAKGLKCPACGSSDGIEGGSIEVDGGTAWQEITCNECGASWNDTYVLTGYANLET